MISLHQKKFKELPSADICEVAKSYKGQANVQKKLAKKIERLTYFNQIYSQ